MGKTIGIEPEYDPDAIKDPMVKGFVNSAIRYAMDQANPSEAVAGFKKALARTDFARLNERYGVPSERLRHQTRARNAKEILAETGQELEKLAQDLARAKEYWDKVFAYATKKYFRMRSREINAALKKARWYPYLRVERARSMNGCPKIKEVRYLNENYTIFYLMPTDKRQKERYARIEKQKHAEEDYGWMFIRQAFGRLNPREQAECLIVQNIQSVKISNKNATATYIAPTIETVLSKKELKEMVVREAQKKGRRYELVNELVSHHAVFNLTSQGMMELRPERILEELERFDAMVSELEKESGFEDVCRRLRKWRAGHPGPAEMEKRARLYSPQTIYKLDFLPALLASICAMEKKSPQEMVSTKCLLIDTSWIEKSKTIAAVGEKRAPKEHAEYMELMKVLSASKLRDGLYLAKFG